MRIAALAWGSLVWDRRNLAIAEDFRPNGPDLPVEFCRVSGDGRLTLVIDEAVETSCQTYSALSAHDDLDAALENLWIREGSKDERLPRHIRKSGRVGFVDVAAGEANATAIERHPRSVEAINACWRDAGRCVISGFHSPLEQQCLDILLRGEQPIVMALARGISALRLPTSQRKALDDGRLTIISPFPATEKRATADLARQRNRFIAALSNEVIFAYIAPGGSLSLLADELAGWGLEPRQLRS